MLTAGLLVAAGGAVGAALRWTVARHLGDRVGTLAVNVAGCLLLGVLAAAGPSLRSLLATGLCGGLTTFSAYAVQVRSQVDAPSPSPSPSSASGRARRRRAGVRLALLHLALCLPAAAVGLAVAS